MVLTKKQILPGVGGLIVLVAAGWFGWQFFEDSAPPPAPKVAKPIARPAAARKATAPPRSADTVKPAPRGVPAAGPVAATPAPAASTPAAAAPEPSTLTGAAQSPVAVARPSVTRARSRATEDARGCLVFATNAEVHKCAEQYR